MVKYLASDPVRSIGINVDDTPLFVRVSTEFSRFANRYNFCLDFEQSETAKLFQLLRYYKKDAKIIKNQYRGAIWITFKTIKAATEFRLLVYNYNHFHRSNYAYLRSVFGTCITVEAPPAFLRQWCKEQNVQLINLADKSSYNQDHSRNHCFYFAEESHDYYDVLNHAWFSLAETAVLVKLTL